MGAHAVRNDGQGHLPLPFFMIKFYIKFWLGLMAATVVYSLLARHPFHIFLILSGVATGALLFSASILAVAHWLDIKWIYLKDLS